MAIIRANKTTNYTVMSNHHLQNKNLTLKAKGLLSQILSLPDDWAYSVDRIVRLNKEGKGAIESAIKELEAEGYVIKTKLLPNQTESNKIEWVYDVYEIPQGQGGSFQGVENQWVENQPIENQGVENQVAYKILNIQNTNIQNTKEQNTNINNNPPYNPPLTGEIIALPQRGRRKPRGELLSWGEFEHVKLSQEEVERLEAKYGAEIAHASIDYFDAYIEEKGVSKFQGQNHNLAIQRWVVNAVHEQRKRNPALNSRNDWIDNIKF